ncbi:MAG: hypothetical protein ACKVVP_13175 [Chloroflexota bacterium]
MDKYKTAAQNYMSQGLRVFIVLPHNFYSPGPPAPQPDPNNPGPDPMNDPYILNFSARVDTFVKYLRDHNAPVRDFIIYNEPGGKLHPHLYASLLYRCWEKINNINSSNKMFWGGIFFDKHDTDPNYVDPNAMFYIHSVYSFLGPVLSPAREQGLQRNWWWHGINVHIHRDRPSSGANDQFLAILNAVDAKRTEWGDAGELLLGEWGITSEEWGSRAPTSTFLLNIYNKIRSRKRPHPSMMFYFAHHYVDERDQGHGQWGLTHYDPGIEGVTPVFVPQTGAAPNGRTVLYVPFKNAMSTQDTT